jgi:non-homologous end joining protein Ku
MRCLRLSEDEFDPEQFRDEYRLRVQSMLDEKSKGKEVSITVPAARHGQLIDLMDALKQSMESTTEEESGSGSEEAEESIISKTGKSQCSFPPCLSSSLHTKWRYKI